MPLSIKCKREGKKWEEFFEWEVHRQMEKPELERAGKVSKKVTKIPEKI